MVVVVVTLSPRLAALSDLFGGEEEDKDRLRRLDGIARTAGSPPRSRFTPVELPHLHAAVVLPC